MSNCLIHVVNEHTNEWKILFDILKDVLTDLPMQFSRDRVDKKSGKKIEGGIRIASIDDKQTLFIYVKLFASKFYKFNIQYPVISNIGIDVPQLYKFLKTIDGKKTILSIEQNDDDKQQLLFEAKDDHGVVSKFKMKILDIEDKNINPPEQNDFDFIVTIDTNDFHKICRDMSSYENLFEICCTKNSITFSCKGDQIAFEKKFTTASGVKIELGKTRKDDKIFQGYFEIKKFLLFSKCVGLCSSMRIYLTNDSPLFTTYTIGDIGLMTTAIAPITKRALAGVGNAYDEANEQFYDKEDNEKDDELIKKKLDDVELDDDDESDNVVKSKSDEEENDDEQENEVEEKPKKKKVKSKS